jgi:uncharacterized protein
MIDQELLSILVCPENKMPVRVAEDSLVESLNTRIDARTLKNRAGETIDERFDSGLVREDGEFLYIIRDDIPIMLIDEAIPLAQ